MQLIEIKRKIDSTEAKKKLLHYRIIDRDFSLTKVTPKEKVICFYENTKNNPQKPILFIYKGGEELQKHKKDMGFLSSFFNFGKTFKTGGTRSGAIGKNFREDRPIMRTKKTNFKEQSKCEFVRVSQRVNTVSMGYVYLQRGHYLPNPIMKANHKPATKRLFNFIRKDLAKPIAEIMHKTLPEEEKKEQLEFIKKINSKYFIYPPYTTVTINCNFQTACHKDSKNFSDAYSAMPVFMTEGFKGGDFCLPEYGLRLRPEYGDVFFFRSEEIWHGNTPIFSTETEKRFSFVFFTNKALSKI